LHKSKVILCFSVTWSRSRGVARCVIGSSPFLTCSDLRWALLLVWQSVYTSTRSARTTRFTPPPPAYTALPNPCYVATGVNRWEQPDQEWPKPFVRRYPTLRR